MKRPGLEYEIAAALQKYSPHETKTWEDFDRQLPNRGSDEKWEAPHEA